MGASVIIAAAGIAQRMKGKEKILCKICGREVLSYSILAFANAKCTDKIVVVTAQDKIDTVKEILSSLKLSLPTVVCVGGKDRQESVMRGLEHCDENSSCVMIHDAARPMIESDKIELLYKKVIGENLKAAALGVAVKDTIKAIDDKGRVVSTPPRKSLFAVQTPQGFEMSLYRTAAEKAIAENKSYTDDCQLVEAMDVPVYMIEGSYENIKITTPEDLITAENFLKERQK